MGLFSSNMAGDPNDPFNLMQQQGAADGATGGMAPAPTVPTLLPTQSAQPAPDAPAAPSFWSKVPAALDGIGAALSDDPNAYQNFQNAQQKKQSDATDQQQTMLAASAKRMADLQDFMTKRQYENANQAPDEITRTLLSAGIDPTSPQGKAIYAQHAATLASPAPQFRPNGVGGGQYYTPPPPQVPGLTAPSGPSVPSVTDQQSYDAVPAGSQYQTPDGHIRMKGGQASASGAFPGNSLDAITMHAESGGNPNAVSTKGATGLMQVMPSTATNPGFGIAPSDGSAADTLRVGKQYRAMLQTKYAGDLAKMWAGYNAGPGRTDASIRNNGSDWLSHMPAETQNYVASNMQRIGG